MDEERREATGDCHGQRLLLPTRDPNVGIMGRHVFKRSKDGVDLTLQ